MTRVLFVPMHGEVKVRAEGCRTRDTHVMEWADRLGVRQGVRVLSRPEPWPRISIARRRFNLPVGRGWTWETKQVWRPPNPRHMARWWVTSAHLIDAPPRATAALAWNPFVVAELVRRDENFAERLVFDLLDDWTRHYAFKPFAEQTREAYAAALNAADVVTANSEGTVRLAAEFGVRAQLVRNGCDPERFALPFAGSADGPPVVGYAGKLGQRIDYDLIDEVVSALPDVTFAFAGPVVAKRRERRAQLARLTQHDNAVVLGDVAYAELPRLFSTWDAAWIPHTAEQGGVAGDPIKAYEYRASGLPVVATPVTGTTYELDGIEVADGSVEVASRLRSLLAAGETSSRGARAPADLPYDVSWRSKTEQLLDLLGLGVADD